MHKGQRETWWWHGERLAAVADGMGGHPGGEVSVHDRDRADRGRLHGASRSTNFRRQCGQATGRSGIEPVRALTLEGMGTTICAAGLDRRRDDLRSSTWATAVPTCIRNGCVDATNARPQRDRRGRTYAGSSRELEALDHPYRGVLTRALGVAPEVELRQHRGRHAVEGDRLLVCTDGLFDGGDQ